MGVVAHSTRWYRDLPGITIRLPPCNVSCVVQRVCRSKYKLATHWCFSLMGVHGLFEHGLHETVSVVGQEAHLTSALEEGGDVVGKPLVTVPKTSRRWLPVTRGTPSVIHHEHFRVLKSHSCPESGRSNIPMFPRGSIYLVHVDGHTPHSREWVHGLKGIQSDCVRVAWVYPVEVHANHKETGPYVLLS